MWVVVRAAMMVAEKVRRKAALWAVLSVGRRVDWSAWSLGMDA